MKLSKSGRIVMLVVGLSVLLVGGFMWSIETDYSALSFVTAEVDGQVQVWEHEIGWDQTDIRLDHPEAKTPEALASAGGTLVFTGSPAGANQYMDEQEQGSKDYIMEGAVLAVGTVLVLISLISGSRVKQTDVREVVNSRS